MFDSALPAISFKWLSQRTESTNIQYSAFVQELVVTKGAKQYFSKFPCPPALQWGYWLLLLNTWFPAEAQVILPVYSYIPKLIIHYIIGRRCKMGKKKHFGKYLIPEMTEVGLFFFLTKYHIFLFSHYFHSCCWICLQQFPLKRITMIFEDLACIKMLGPSKIWYLSNTILHKILGF